MLMLNIDLSIDGPNFECFCLDFKIYLRNCSTQKFEAFSDTNTVRANEQIFLILSVRNESYLSFSTSRITLNEGKPLLMRFKIWESLYGMAKRWFRLYNDNIMDETRDTLPVFYEDLKARIKILFH